MGGICEQRSHPSFSCTGQRRAQRVVTVIQLPVGLPDKEIRKEKKGRFLGTNSDFYFNATRCKNISLN